MYTSLVLLADVLDCTGVAWLILRIRETRKPRLTEILTLLLGAGAFCVILIAGRKIT